MQMGQLVARYLDWPIGRQVLRQAQVPTYDTEMYVH